MKYKTLILVFSVFLAVSGFDAHAQSKLNGKKQTAGKVQYVTIELNERGYRPASFRLKKGTPARVTFIRKTNDDCGREIVFPSYNIRRELPLNRPVTISFTPKKTGAFDFTCGMDMLRGQVIVQ